MGERQKRYAHGLLPLALMAAMILALFVATVPQTVSAHGDDAAVSGGDMGHEAMMCAMGGCMMKHNACDTHCLRQGGEELPPIIGSAWSPDPSVHPHEIPSLAVGHPVHYFRLHNQMHAPRAHVFLKPIMKRE